MEYLVMFLIIVILALIIYLTRLKTQIPFIVQEEFKTWCEREAKTIQQQEKDAAQRESHARIEIIHRESEARIKEQANQKAQEYYRSWCDKELESIHKQQTALAQREATTNLERWKTDHEQSIKQEAIKKSQNVIAGKVTEQLVPYLPNFRYNSKDARFIGSPIDFIVFDGLDNGEVRNVVFIEVKTGVSALSKREKQVREAIEARNVKWEVMRVDLERADYQKTKLAQPTTNTSRNDNIVVRAYSLVESYKVGETISHQAFGIGRVINVENHKIEVQFAHCIKLLVHREN